MPDARWPSLMTLPDNIRIQFLYFKGCPWADEAKESLEAALSECGLSTYEEIDILDPATPAESRSWGSPTILVNGDDVGGQQAGDGPGCRLYPNGEPSTMSIVASIKRAGDVWGH